MQQKETSDMTGDKKKCDITFAIENHFSTLLSLDKLETQKENTIKTQLADLGGSPSHHTISPDEQIRDDRRFIRQELIKYPQAVLTVRMRLVTTKFQDRYIDGVHIRRVHRSASRGYLWTNPQS